MNRALRIDEIHEEIQRLDPALGPTEPAYSAAVVLLSALVVGPSIPRLHEFTKLPNKLLRKISRRCRTQRIWKGSRINADWFGDGSGLSFWLDVSVAVGLLDRAEIISD